ncbi:hypothetical protein HJC23_006328 [Cyclotella cryptica]|uniref:Uncharacterized protein n=1 Tax=Cyclotella cryptica TaxID=29204 RepID=A0ABD3Q4L7_9STRA
MESNLFGLSSVRSLRGGGGGGSGGSSGYSGGAGSSYGSSSCNGDCEGTGYEWLLLIVGTVLSMFFGCFYYYYYYYKKKADTEAAIVKDMDFEAAVSEARRNIAYASSSPSSCDVRHQTYSGIFDSKYSDRGKTLTAVLTLRLVDGGTGGYEIRGEGSDADGTTKVTDGFIAYDGSGWWLEETCSGKDTGLKVLSKGTFDFANNTFSGSWRSSSKYQGNYVSVRGRNVTKTMAPINENACNGNDALKFEAGRNLPIAIPIEMTPVVVKP